MSVQKAAWFIQWLFFDIQNIIQGQTLDISATESSFLLLLLIKILRLYV